MNKPKYETQVQIRFCIDKENLNKLAAEAAKQHRALSAIIDDLIAEHL